MIAVSITRLRNTYVDATLARRQSLQIKIEFIEIIEIKYNSDIPASNKLVKKFNALISLNKSDIFRYENVLFFELFNWRPASKFQNNLLCYFGFNSH